MYYLKKSLANDDFSYGIYLQVSVFRNIKKTIGLSELFSCSSLDGY